MAIRFNHEIVGPGGMMDEMDSAKPLASKVNLEIMSVEELEKLITKLEAEIVKARMMIAAKKNAHSDANTYFKP